MQLIAPGNKLVYPYGPQAAINREHPAFGPRLRYAGVPIGNSFVNLLNGKTATIASGTPVAKMSPLIGASVNFPASAGLATTIPSETPVGVIAAAIFTPTSTSVSNGVVFITGAGLGGSNDFGILQNSGVFRLWVSGSSSTIPNFPSYTANKPYFVAICSYQASGGLALAGAMTDLTTGQTYFGTNTGTHSFGGIGTTFDIGSWGASNASLANVAAVAYSTDAISPAALQQWALDPWSLWYPQTMQKLIQNMAVKGRAAGAAPGAAALLVGL